MPLLDLCPLSSPSGSPCLTVDMNRKLRDWAKHTTPPRSSYFTVVSCTNTSNNSQCTAFENCYSFYLDIFQNTVRDQLLKWLSHILYVQGQENHLQTGRRNTCLLPFMWLKHCFLSVLWLSVKPVREHIYYNYKSMPYDQWLKYRNSSQVY